MKQILLGALLFSSLLSSAATINLAGKDTQIDTLAHRWVGPGTTYTHCRLPELPVEIHTLTIDLNDPNNSIETFLGKDSIANTELVTSACARYSYDGHEAFGGINADFFNVAAHNEFPLGAPRGGSIRDGVIQREPNSSWWGFASIDSNKKPVLDYMEFSGKVTNATGQTFPILHVNIPRANCDLTLFNSYAGARTRPYENEGGFGNDDRTEVYVQPISGGWKVNGPVRCIVTKIIKNKGLNPIGKDETVLSGVRTALPYLNALTVGDELTLDLNIRTKANTYPNIEQLVGGNAMILQQGLFTDRNYTDSYNNVVYPRTGIASSADGRYLYWLVADGKQGAFSNGITTETMAAIFKYMGASEAVGLDGGGSSEMIVNHSVMNKPADGTERPVGNGWMVIANAPTDNTIARIEFDLHNLQVPIFSELNPKILGYNQYGLLIDQNVQGATLTCTPNVGMINSNGNFSAGGTVGTGTLTASLNGISVTRPLHVIEASLSLRMDSMLIDGRKGYPLQVQSQIGQNIMIADPAAFNWIVADPTVCRVENGMIFGLKNGSTTVTGTLNDFTGTVKIHVEIPNSGYYIQDDFSANNGWSITAQTNWNVQFSSQIRPNHWTHGDSLNYVYQTNRAPSIKLSRTLPFYSLPDSVILVINPGEIGISKIVASIKSNDNNVSLSKEYTQVAMNKDFALVIQPEDLGLNKTDLIHYPLWFDYVTFYITPTSQTVGKSYSLGLKELVMCYEGISVGITHPERNQNLICYPNPTTDGTAFIHWDGIEQKAVSVQISTLDGKKVKHQLLQPEGNKLTLDVASLLKGTYIVNLTQNNKKESFKIIIN